MTAGTDAVASAILVLWCGPVLLLSLGFSFLLLHLCIHVQFDVCLPSHRIFWCVWAVAVSNLLLLFSLSLSVSLSLSFFTLSFSIFQFLEDHADAVHQNTQHILVQWFLATRPELFVLMVFYGFKLHACFLMPAWTMVTDNTYANPFDGLYLYNLFCMWSFMPQVIAGWRSPSPLLTIVCCKMMLLDNFFFEIRDLQESAVGTAHHKQCFPLKLNPREK